MIWFCIRLSATECLHVRTASQSRALAAIGPRRAAWEVDACRCCLTGESLPVLRHPDHRQLLDALPELMSRRVR